MALGHGIDQPDEKIVLFPRKLEIPSKDSPSLDSTSDFSDKVLVISGTAWEKMMYLANKSTNEISGFGISRPPDPLDMVDFQVIDQIVSSAGTKMDPVAVGKFICEQDEKGISPINCSRIWVHSHTMSMTPSPVDMDQMNSDFGRCHWMVMMIISRNERDATAYIQFNTPSAHVLVDLSIQVDYTHDYLSRFKETWDKEYDDHVKKEVRLPKIPTCNRFLHEIEPDDYEAIPGEWLNTWLTCPETLKSRILSRYISEVLCPIEIVS